jgi:hypothetical protein
VKKVFIIADGSAIINLFSDKTKGLLKKLPIKKAVGTPTAFWWYSRRECAISRCNPANL